MEKSYQEYRDQYQQHLDRYMAFVSEVDWDMDKIKVLSKGNILTLIRPDKKSMRLNVLQIVGLLRYVGQRIQALEQGEQE